MGRLLHKAGAKRGCIMGFGSAGKSGKDVYKRQGQKYQNQAWIDESIHQVLMHIKYLCDKETGLFYHGWTFNERNNFGGIFWCRGNSWFTLGILDYIDMFRGTMNAGVKEFVVDTYKAQAEALKGLQGKSGLWHTVPVSYTHLDVYKRQPLSMEEMEEFLKINRDGSAGGGE